MSGWSQSADSVAFNIQADEEEFEILKSLYEKAGGSRWKNNTNWLKGKTHADFATWFGVTVEHGDVVAIDLRDNGLKGELPDLVYKLVRLRQVSIENNTALRGERGKALGIAKQSGNELADELKYAKPQYGFIENKGQIHDQQNNPQPDVKFLLPLPNNNVVLRGAGFSYDTHVIEEKERTHGPTAMAGYKFDHEQVKDITYKFHRVDVELVDANPNPEIITSEQSSDYLMYHTGIQGSSQRVYHYGKVLYKNIYPNIDLEFVARPGETKPIEYSFYVHPGGDFKQIKLQYKGASQGALVNGKVELTLAHGKLTENIPASFMQRSRANVDIRYKMIGDSMNELTVGFEGIVNISEETLIIDPVPSLTWSSYYGGSGGLTTGVSVVRDQNGDLYLGGASSSTQLNAIATSGVHQSIKNAFTDAYIAKFDPAGIRLWGTFFGGNFYDEATSISIDQSGSVYVLGRTNSGNSSHEIATANSHQQQPGGTPGTSYDVFLLKLTSGGLRQWSTYYGGSGEELGFSVTTDLLGNVFIVGATGSEEGIATPDGYKSSLTAVANSQDAFLVKFNSIGVRLWGTYFGGPSYEIAYTVKVDNLGDIIMAGGTASNTNIATGGAYLTSLASSGTNGFLTKFSTSGNIQWSTYYGEIHDIAIGNSNEIFVCGFTSQNDQKFTSQNSSQPTYGGGSFDAFLAKFSSNGIREWGTYYGSNSIDYGFSVTVSDNDIVYLAGETQSSLGNGFIASPDGFQTSYGGGYNDGFMASFNTNGGRLWGSFFGGNGYDKINSIISCQNGSFLIAGSTTSPNLPMVNAHQSSLSSSQDAFIALFNSNQFTCPNEYTTGLNLPQWALGVKGPKTQLVDWRTTTPNITNAQNSSSATVPFSGNVALDGCGQLAFYALHTGPDVTNRLHIFAPNGTRLTNEIGGSPLLALNSAFPFVELQIVKVPGFENEWYIIYSLHQGLCSSTSAHCPARVVYARVRYISATQALTIISREIDVNSTLRFTNGKAVSTDVNGDESKHYLYLAERQASINTSRFHRFIIDSSGIHSGTQTPNTFPAQYWNLTIYGSSVELSADGNFLAFLNRNEHLNYEDIIVFDTREFLNSSYSPVIVKVPNLILVPDDQTLFAKTSIVQLYTSNPSFSCLINLKNKLYGLQFSPSGQFLYVTGGGFVVGQTAYTHRTYLMQIDLATGTGVGDYEVRLQVQEPVGSSACNGTTLTSAGTNFHPIGFVQAGYDGRLYFTKENEPTLFVIPEPDCAMPQRLTPGNVDLSTPSVPNLIMNDGSFVYHMPETIDGYNYRQSGNGQIADLAITTDQYLCAIKFATNRIPDCQTTYLWNFGDGNTSLARAPIHVYSASGTFNVTVSITSNCASCSGSVELTRQVSFTLPTTVVKDTTIQVLSEQKLKVVNHSVSTFSDAWPLPHENVSLSEKNGFVNGSDGVWRNNGVYIYQAPRTATETVNIRTDGTYTLQTFNWRHAELQAIPNWTKANAITRYSPYSYELENRDVLGVYSAAVYDHYGQLPVATGVNMRNEEMAFTSFESVSGQPEGPSTGNWTIGSQNLPEYNYFSINAANGHMATVETPIAKLQGLTAADVGVYAMGPGEITNYQQNVGIVCMQQHPNTPNWTIVVLAVEPAAGVWTGTLRIKNIINQSGSPVLDNTRAHSGKRSLRINAPTTHKQELLKLQSGKRYHVSAWVSVGNPNVATPTLANNLGFDIILKQKTGQVISTTSFAPAGQVIEGWQQIRGVLDVPGDQPVIELVFKPGSLGTAWYDDLRLHPENGNMKSYVYNLLDYRLSAILDEENFASYFFYDAEGNLYLTKKETRDGVKTLTENMTYQVER